VDEPPSASAERPTLPTLAVEERPSASAEDAVHGMAAAVADTPTDASSTAVADADGAASGVGSNDAPVPTPPAAEAPTAGVEAGGVEKGRQMMETPAAAVEVEAELTPATAESPSPATSSSPPVDMPVEPARDGDTFATAGADRPAGGDAVPSDAPATMDALERHPTPTSAFSTPPAQALSTDTSTETTGSYVEGDAAARGDPDDAPAAADEPRARDTPDGAAQLAELRRRRAADRARHLPPEAVASPLPGAVAVPTPDAAASATPKAYASRTPEAVSPPTPATPDAATSSTAAATPDFVAEEVEGAGSPPDGGEEASGTTEFVEAAGGSGQGGSPEAVSEALTGVARDGPAAPVADDAEASAGTAEEPLAGAHQRLAAAGTPAAVDQEQVDDAPYGGATPQAPPYTPAYAVPEVVDAADAVAARGDAPTTDEPLRTPLPSATPPAATPPAATPSAVSDDGGATAPPAERDADAAAEPPADVPEPADEAPAVGGAADVAPPPRSAPAVADAPDGRSAWAGAGGEAADVPPPAAAAASAAEEDAEAEPLADVEDPALYEEDDDPEGE